MTNTSKKKCELNEKGQCPYCLIKPLTYKRDGHYFCHRCCRAFDIKTRKMIENTAWSSDNVTKWPKQVHGCCGISLEKEHAPGCQKEQPKCKYCWDKGFYSVWKGIHGSTDFPGDPNYGKNPYWNNIPCPRCNPEQPEQKVHNRLVNMAIGHVRDTAQPSALITQPQELRQEECDCNDIEYCSACIDSPKAPVGWKNCLNKRFRFKRSLDDRHIYYLADDDDDETQYGYLDQFIEVLMMQAEQKAREEEREKANKIFDWLLGIEGDFPSRKEGDPPYYWRKILREKLKSLTPNHHDAQVR